MLEIALVAGRKSNFTKFRMTPLRTFLAISLIVACSSCSGGGGTGPPPVPVSVQLMTFGNRTALDEGETLQITATVRNGSGNQGVVWSLLIGSGCINPGGCGSLSSATANPVTYSPPQTVTTAFQVSIAATADADGRTQGFIELTVEPLVSVMIQNKQGAIQAGTATLTFAAFLQNDFMLGVQWSLSGSSCANPPNACGTLAAVPGSITATYYTPPAEAPAPSPLVTLTATSVLDPSRSDQFTFTITAASTVVTLSGKFNTVAAGGSSQQLTATVAHDPGGGGVTWSLTAGSPPVACEPNCGTLSNPMSSTVNLITTATITYTPPPGPPVPAAPNAAPSITATSKLDASKADSDSFTIQDFTCGRGSEGLLHGEYAFLAKGFKGSGNETPIAIVGSLGADGMGGVSGGEEDIDQFPGYQHVMVAAAGSSYSVGSDGRGCLTIASSVGTALKYRFALGNITAGVAGKGRLIESDDTTGLGIRSSGFLLLQDPNSFSLNQLEPNYAFGVDGWAKDGVFGHFAMAGSFSVAQGNLSNGNTDLNDTAFICSESTNGSGNLGVFSATGRSEGTYNPHCGSTYEIAIYMVSAQEFLIIGKNENGTPLFSGRAISTGNSFSASSVSGNYLLDATGSFINPNDGSINGHSHFELLDFKQSGLDTTVYEYFNDNGILTVTSSTNAAFSVGSSSGRVALSPGTPSDVIYLATPHDGISGFFVSRDTDAAFGEIIAQPNVSYSSGALQGEYLIATEDPNQLSYLNFSGLATLSSTGAISGTLDASGPNGLRLNQPFALNVTINADGTGDEGANTILLTNGARIIILQQSPGGPAQVTILDSK